MRPFRSWPLAAKLSVDLLLAALIPLAVVLWIASTDSRRALERSARHNLQLAATATAGRLDQLIGDTVRSAQQLAGDDASVTLCTVGGDPARAAAQRRLEIITRTNPDVASAFLVGAGAVGLASTNPRNVGQDLSFRVYVRAALAGELHVSEWLVGKTTGEPGVYIAAPVRGEDGGVRGAAVLKLRGDRIQEMIAEVRPGEGGFAALIDANGVVIAHPRTDLLYHSVGALSDERIAQIDPQLTYSVEAIPSLGLDAVLAALESSEGAGAVRFDSDQGARVAGFAPLSSRRWKAAVIQPQEQFEAEGAELARRQGGAALLVAGLAAGLSFVRARSIVRPLVDVSGAVDKLAEGDFGARAPKHADDEIGRLADAFNAMAPRLQHAVEVQHSLAVAMEVQQSLLPAADPKLSRLEVAGRSRYCDETGGDYYDFIDVSSPREGSTLIAVGDVMGHGVAAALLMASARAALRAAALEHGELGVLLTRVNTLLAGDRHNRFMTLSLLVIDADSGEARWASAGHDPAIVYFPDSGEFTELDGGDMPLGVDRDTRYEEYSRRGLRPGCTVVVGTDGVWEAASPSGELFGKDRLRALVRAHGAGPVAALADAIERAVTEHRGPGSQADDITFVAARLL